MTVLIRDYPLQTPSRSKEHEAILTQYQSDRSCPILSCFPPYSVSPTLPAPPHSPTLTLKEFSKPGEDEKLQEGVLSSDEI